MKMINLQGIQHNPLKDLLYKFILHLIGYHKYITI